MFLMIYAQICVLRRFKVTYLLTIKKPHKSP
nr:MAG TPA: hypothetical protein [Caudoviricetes sp.]